MDSTSAGNVADVREPVSDDTRRRAVIAGCIGNFVEWYDFALYGAFAPVIAATFFPERDALGGLLATYLVFVMAFAARPAGALLFGHIGDRVGRRQALAGGIVLMAVVTAATGVLPGYATIGWAAPALLALLRVGQGVAVGGEYGGSAAFVIEYAPADRRGFYCGWQWATVALGFATGIAAAAVLGAVLPAPALHSWGWRLPFVLALPLGQIGLYIRVRLEDTPRFNAMKQAGAVAHAPLAGVLGTARRQVLIGFGVVAAVTVTFNTFFVFLPGYVGTSRPTQGPLVLAAALVGLVTASAVAPLSGRLTDRIGRRPVMCGCAIVLAAAAVPASRLVERGDTVGTVVAYTLVGVLLGGFGPTAFLSELFPTRFRYSGLSLTYGVGSAVFGGTAPFVATVLAGRTGNAQLASWYVTVVSIVAIACVVAAPETADQPLHEGEGADTGRPHVGATGRRRFTGTG